MDNQDLNLQYQSRKVPPPNMVPPSQPTSQHQQQLTPHAPSGRPATPRMLRSISGTLKSKTELNNSSRERTQDYNNGANNTNSPHYVTNNTMDTHKRQPSFPQQTSTPVTQDQRNIKVQAPTAVPADQQQQRESYCHQHRSQVLLARCILLQLQLESLRRQIYRPDKTICTTACFQSIGLT